MRQERLLGSKDFCFDTSFIVRLFETFPRSIHTVLWDKIEAAIKGRCHIICEVEAELKVKFEEYYEWCVEQKIPVWEIDEDCLHKAREVIKQYPTWIKPKTTDLYFADPFLIAHALQNDCMIICAEKSEDPAKHTKEPKIPDVCVFYKIDCIGQAFGEIEAAPIKKFLALLKISN